MCTCDGGRQSRDVVEIFPEKTESRFVPIAARATKM